MRGANQNQVPDAPTRQDQWFVQASLLNPTGGNIMKHLGAFDKKSGGEVDSDDNKYYPGAVYVDGPISIGGRKTTGNLTLQRIWDRDNDEDCIQHLYDNVGKGRVRVSIRSKDEDGIANGKIFQYLGTLKRVSIPDFDSESGTAALMELEIIIAKYPTIVNG